MLSDQLIRHVLVDDGEVPNNPRCALLHYKSQFLRDSWLPTPDETLACFIRHGWRGGWVNGIYPFHHYHARSHEVLANLGDAVIVQFGGRHGPEIVFRPGDVVAIPAGCGHCRKSDPANLVIVGAYPAGQEDWDLKRANPEDHARALAEIPLVPLPKQDPVFGTAGGVLDYWS
jgi:uncharacterized protein YjlB